MMIETLRHTIALRSVAVVAGTALLAGCALGEAPSTLPDRHTSTTPLSPPDFEDPRIVPVWRDVSQQTAEVIGCLLGSERLYYERKDTPLTVVSADGTRTNLPPVEKTETVSNTEVAKPIQGAGVSVSVSMDRLTPIDPLARTSANTEITFWAAADKTKDPVDPFQGVMIETAPTDQKVLSSDDPSYGYFRQAIKTTRESATLHAVFFGRDVGHYSLNGTALYKNDAGKLVVASYSEAPWQPNGNKMNMDYPAILEWKGVVYGVLKTLIKRSDSCPYDLSEDAWGRVA